MPPLVGIAISMLPGLAKRVADNVLPDVEDRITRTVRDVLGTEDPKKVEELIADPAVAAELRVKLAQIEADADVRQAEIQQKKREAELEKFKVELETFREEVKDTQSARGLLSDLAKQGSPFAWGTVVVSSIVVLGFFVTMTLLVFRALPVGSNEQMLNIVVGALTAGFATVISFWLGSSQSSRAKDAASLQTQNVVVDMQRASTQTAERLVQEQQRQTTALIERVTTNAPAATAGAAPPPTPTAAPPTPVAVAKGPKHFHDCMELIFEHEGGYVDHEKDPGGATNLGITHRTLAAFRGVESVSRDEVKALTHDEAREIYRLEYWNKLNCDSLPAGVDLVTFDFGVNAGPSRAAKMLQDIVASKVDGQIGARTIAAVQSFGDQKLLINAFSDRRLEYYRSLPHWPTFGTGWTRRTEATRKAALAMAGS